MTVKSKLSSFLSVPILASVFFTPYAHAAGDWKFDEARVGQVFVASTNSTCGGTLIGSDLVLTAAHCVVAHDSSDPVDIRDVTFSIQDKEEGAMILQAIDIATDPEFVRQGGPTRESISRDIALIRLDSHVRGGVDFMAPLDKSQTHVALLPVVEDATFAGEPCEASYEENGIVVLSCERAKGASGSPAFSMVDGARKIVAVISANGVRDDKPVTFAANPLNSLGNMRWIGKVRATPSGY